MGNDKYSKLVSVIIPTYNRALVLCDCIDSILKSTYSNLEIIVVDNASTDNTVNLVKKRYRNSCVRLIELNENLMAAGGRNEGIKNARGEYLLFVDNDNVVYSDMIEILVDRMESDKKVGLVGPISLNKKTGETIWIASGKYNFFSSRQKKLYTGKRIDEVNLEKEYETCFSPNVMMVSRKAIEAVGGFDRNYYAMFEENDFGYRILKAGFSNYIVTDARTLHMGHTGDSEVEKLRRLGIESPERAWHFAKNRSVFIKKHAKWYEQIFFFTVCIHVLTIYYCFVSIQQGRADIAKAWIDGTIRGVFFKVDKGIKVNI